MEYKKVINLLDTTPNTPNTPKYTESTNYI